MAGSKDQLEMGAVAMEGLLGEFEFQPLSSFLNEA